MLLHGKSGPSRLLPVVRKRLHLFHTVALVHAVLDTLQYFSDACRRETTARKMLHNAHTKHKLQQHMSHRMLTKEHVRDFGCGSHTGSLQSHAKLARAAVFFMQLLIAAAAAHMLMRPRAKC
jgi:hypothetical protein